MLYANANLPNGSTLEQMNTLIKRMETYLSEFKEIKQFQKSVELSLIHILQTQPDNRGNVDFIPLRELINVAPAEDLKSITSGRNGEYVPVSYTHLIVKQIRPY